MKRNLFLTLMLVALVALVFAIPVVMADVAAYTSSLGTIDVYKINEATPGLREVRLGERLEGPLKKETSDVTTDGAMDLDVDDRVVFFTTTAVQGTNDPSLANSVPGHQMTFVLETDAGWAVDITPLTKTGFTSVTLQDAKDSCTIEYANDTDGWFLVSNNGCTIN